MKKKIIKFICFFIPIKSWRKKIKDRLMYLKGGSATTKEHPNPKGRVLIAYLKDSILLEDDDVLLQFHSNRWENREIARIFYELGYSVDCVDFNVKFYTKKKYDVIFGIENHFLSNEKISKKSTIRFLHLTSSYADFNNAKEDERMENLRVRKGVRLPREREFFDYLKNCQANAISLIGNEFTKNTFPEKYRDKIQLIDPTGSQLTYIKQEQDYYPVEKEFLWMGGAGPVHKGLDLLLEIFAKHPEWKLNIFGRVSKRSKFYKLYKQELENMPNIKFYGWVPMSSELFNDTIKKCFAFLSPSCAEGACTAAITAMTVGLYPLISYENGIDLPKGCGKYLGNCSIDEIEQAIKTVYEKPEDEIKKEIKTVQVYCTNKYSRENFSKQMKEFISSQLDEKKINC